MTLLPPSANHHRRLGLAMDEVKRLSSWISSSLSGGTATGTELKSLSESLLGFKNLGTWEVLGFRVKSYYKMDYGILAKFPSGQVKSSEINSLAGNKGLLFHTSWTSHTSARRCQTSIWKSESEVKVIYLFKHLEQVAHSGLGQVFIVTRSTSIRFIIR